MNRLVLGLVAISLGLFAAAADAFEIKGYTPGMSLTSAIIKDCEAIPNADSGIPGYSCLTTLGGDQAVLRLAVFDEQLVAAVWHVESGNFRAMLDALSEKYGNPRQSNRYIEDYSWREGRQSLSIKQNSVERKKYAVLLADFNLYDRAKASQKEKAKKDL
jgi:hypothetical protein